MAGQYAKSEADRRFRRIATLLMVFAAVAGICLGYALALFQFFWVVVTASVSLALLLWLLSLTDRALSSMARERVKYLRGAQAEAYVGWMLFYLPESWHVFHGVTFDDFGDIDHIVVGPSGVFCISTKSSRGTYSLAPDGALLLNGSPCDHIEKAQRQTMRLHDRLTGFFGSNVPWIQPVLAAPLAFVAFDSRKHNVWVLHQDNLFDTFQQLKARLSTQQINQIVSALEWLREQGQRGYAPAKTQHSGANQADG